MPKGVYTRTPQHRVNISLAHQGQVPWNKGKKGIYSKETLIKMGEASKGRKPWCTGKELSLEHRQKLSTARIGKEPWNKGVVGVYSNETLAKMKTANRKKAKRGKDHHNWQGGITPKNRLIRHSYQYKEWRKAVFERDNYTCQFCGEQGGKLNADHIKPFSTHHNLRLELSNGRTLCVECHKKTDTYSRSKIIRANTRGDKNREAEKIYWRAKLKELEAID